MEKVKTRKEKRRDSVVWFVLERFCSLDPQEQPRSLASWFLLASLVARPDLWALVWLKGGEPTGSHFPARNPHETHETCQERANRTGPLLLPVGLIATGTPLEVAGSWRACIPSPRRHWFVAGPEAILRCHSSPPASSLSHQLLRGLGRVWMIATAA
jgi:hypothetical protein